LPAKDSDIELHIHGVVQGVGFRPFVYRLAAKFSMAGSVANTADGVIIQLYAPGRKVADFIQALRDNAPVMARITDIEQKYCQVLPTKSFIVCESEKADKHGKEIGIHGIIPPDTALCPDCLRELFDPTDRRYRYPFINCTNCGPRFTIISCIPYDRPNTSMDVFPMCAPCLTEYQNPANRRFHAEPNACPDCGPKLSWHDATGNSLDVVEPVREAAQALRQGKIVAIRGLGGFHLAVDAENEAAVAELRRRKGRAAKPLAVMFADIPALKRYCQLEPAEQKIAASPERPIILLRIKDDTGLAVNLAPGIKELGCMLPYTPLHHLLFAGTEAPAALVMTSGNKSGAPICITNEQALAELAGVTDFYLLHNREILTRADDSVGRYMAGAWHLFRRSRGYVPRATKIPAHLPPVIACGAELKSTFCLTRGSDAFLSQHIGDLTNAAVLDFYTESVEHLKSLLQVEPVAAVCDMHPDYLSRRYAEGLGIPLIKVQHHHAHAAAVMVEHGLDKCLAVVMDGTGWGPDNTSWGGEILLADLDGYQRLAHLQTLPMPGGDRAARQGWRMGLAAAYLAGFTEFGQPSAVRPRSYADDSGTTTILCDRKIIFEMLAKDINCPRTSSAGRLFDAVASILGIRQISDYEGQAAMELEAMASGQADWLHEELCLPVCIERQEKVILSVPMLQKMLELAGNCQTAYLARQFHLWLCHSVCAMLGEIAPPADLPLVLAGGCMQNNLLLSGLTDLLRQQNYMVYSGEEIPVNDGGLALGQAVIGGVYVSGRTHAGC
jgi:hydrogenase maturation protein HypF